MRDRSDDQTGLNASTADALVQEYRDRLARNTSRIFAALMLLQWAGAIITAMIISPRTWSGTVNSVHIHIWAALVLGGIITILPVALALLYPTRVITRHVIAAGQMLMSALLIDITGGRIETHFHVFGSLAILAFYRDWRVLLTGTIVVYIDHVARGLYWPQSVYGVLYASPWRAVEHAWWVGFEVLFLTIAIRHSISELSSINKQMETFCYSMSHDLKAPLRGIHSYAQILAQDHGSELTSQAKDCLGRIQESATKMNRLLNDLLEYSRVSTAKFTVVPVEISKVTNEAVRLLAAEIQEQGATIKLEPDLGIVLGH
jgi:signal transduction histidine kinase